MISIGLMSGTSMDGIDAALLSTDGAPNSIQDLGNCSMAYAQPFKILLKAAEYAVRTCSGHLSAAESGYEQNLRDYLTSELKMTDQAIPQRLAELSDYLRRAQHDRISLSAVIRHSTELHGLAVNNLLQKTGYSAQQIDVVGYHGQTLFHQPQKKISAIVGDGQQLANSLGIRVVNDFRRRDIEAGGLGAPFAPLYHQALAVRDKKIPMAVINCGGIANITLINSANELDLVAFDTGPGNGLIDRLVRQRTQGREQMDADGQYGRRGRVNETVLAALYDHGIIQNQQNYFSLPPPKALDIGDLTLIPELNHLSLEDACATLEAFTADAIVNSLNFLTIDLPEHWILAGGGWHNPVIRQELNQRLQQHLKRAPHIQTADEIGWNSQAMEAQIFAYLAVRSLQNQPLSVPGTTRVPYPLSGGVTYFPTICQ